MGINLPFFFHVFALLTVSRIATSGRHGGDGEPSRLRRGVASGVFHVPRVQGNTGRPHIFLQRQPRLLRSTPRGNSEAQVFRVRRGKCYLRSYGQVRC